MTFLNSYVLNRIATYAIGSHDYLWPNPEPSDGVTEVGARIVRREDGKLPRWFILIPTLAGFAYGILSYFSETPDEVLAAIKVWRRVLDAVMRGLISFGGAVVIFELRKQVWKKIRGKLGVEEKNGSEPKE